MCRGAQCPVEREDRKWDESVVMLAMQKASKAGRVGIWGWMSSLLRAGAVRAGSLQKPAQILGRSAHA